MKLRLRGKALTATSVPRGVSAPIRYIDDALLEVDHDGRIAKLEPFSRRSASGAVLDVHPAVIVPGFVDAHVHGPQTRVRGSATGPLLDWLDRSVFPEEARFASLGYAAEVAAECVALFLAAGTTAVGLYGTSSAAATTLFATALSTAGLCGHVGPVLMDRGAPADLLVPPDRALADLAAFAARVAGLERLRAAVTPRFALSCTPEMLSAAGAFAAENEAFVMTHLSENVAECEATNALFPSAGDYLGVYEAAGLVGPRSLLAHAIHLSDAEWDRIARARAVLVHCPDSNFFLGSGAMRLAEAMRRGVRVALGSDVGAGRSFDVRRTASAAYDASRVLKDPVDPGLLFALATSGGADALGFGDRTGQLAPGFDADLVTVGLPTYVRGANEVLGHVLFASETARVERVWLQGALADSRIDAGNARG